MTPNGASALSPDADTISTSAVTPGGAGACFDIYGYRYRVECDVPEVLRGLADDFAFFAAEPRGDEAGPVGDEAVLTIEAVAPDYERWVGAKAAVYTPRNVAYKQGVYRVIDYSGRALGVHNVETGDFRISSLNHDLLYEAAFLFLLSQSGERLDSHGFHRVHALGVSVGGRGALVLLPMGGGKSTLGSALLRFEDVELLSDDSPLVDGKGDLYAFPLRIGLLPGSEGAIPADQLRTIQRMEFGPKLLVNYKFFADRVCARAEPAHLFIGSRSLREDCVIRPASRLEVWKALVAGCVVGMGLFQGMEFVFGRGVRGVVSMMAVAWARVRACRQLMKRSQVWHLELGRNSERNAEAVVQLLRSGMARK